ncbi:MAG: hypothetical protein EBT14_09015, partial [Betaproteobacteria bacterium]|nr:hypothetical protein [Betaproteobacteria bacterium]
ARGVKVSTRREHPGYHNNTWPRRRRCKEGNLAYFYDHYGYEQYDVVVQLDADHRPEPGYLRAMVHPFADPHVGYVSAPSICDRNEATSWVARGRLYAESVLHGPLQLGLNAGFAPLCIGSHYAVRTAALAGIPLHSAPRRLGDPAALVSDSSKAKSLLRWEPHCSSIAQIVSDAAAWDQRQRLHSEQELSHVSL